MPCCVPLVAMGVFNHAVDVGDKLGVALSLVLQTQQLVPDVVPELSGRVLHPPPQHFMLLGRHTYKTHHLIQVNFDISNLLGLNKYIEISMGSRNRSLNSLPLLYQYCVFFHVGNKLTSKR